MQSLNALYPCLQGNTEVANINLEKRLDLANIDLLHIPFNQIQDLLYRNSSDDVRKESLSSYRGKGGVILIEADNKSEGNFQNISLDINNLFKSLNNEYSSLQEWDSDD